MIVEPGGTVEQSFDVGFKFGFQLYEKLVADNLSIMKDISILMEVDLGAHRDSPFSSDLTDQVASQHRSSVRQVTSLKLSVTL